MRADHYVAALDPGALARALRGAEDLSSRMAELDARSRVPPDAGCVHIRRKDHLRRPDGARHAGRAGCLLVRAEGSYWKAPMSLGTGKTREIPSVAFAIPDAPGILYGKPAHACTREEIVEEILVQSQTGAWRAPRVSHRGRADD